MNFKKTLETAKTENAARDAYAEKTAELSHSILSTKAEMDEALKRGKSQTFTELAKKATALEAAMRSLTENPPKDTITAAKLSEAWNEYCAAESKAYQEKLSAFKEAKEALCNSFLELFEIQRNLLEEKSSVCKLLSYMPYQQGVSMNGSDLMKPAEFPKSANEETTRIFGYKTIPEIAYFIASGLVKKEQFPALFGVIQYDKPCSRADFEDPFQCRNVF
jgi:hypothetical protein